MNGAIVPNAAATGLLLNSSVLSVDFAMPVRPRTVGEYVGLLTFAASTGAARRAIANSGGLVTVGECGQEKVLEHASQMALIAAITTMNGIATHVLGGKLITADALASFKTALIGELLQSAREVSRLSWKQFAAVGSDLLPDGAITDGWRGEGSYSRLVFGQLSMTQSEQIFNLGLLIDSDAFEMVLWLCKRAEWLA
jgi:hypothetical protein